MTWKLNWKNLWNATLMTMPCNYVKEHKQKLTLSWQEKTVTIIINRTLNNRSLITLYKTMALEFLPQRITCKHFTVTNIKNFYFMAESASGQDKGNPVFWLVTRVGKIQGPPYPLEISHFGPARISSFSGHTTNPLFTLKHEVKIAGYWRPSFFMFLLTLTSFRFVNTQTRTWPISSHLGQLTSWY